MKDRTLFRGAVYYAANDWPDLVKFGIDPFLKETAPYLKNYYIFLSNYRGEHIKLIVELKDDARDEFTKQYKDFFTDFLNKNPSSNPTVKFVPGKSIWMNCLNNSLEVDNFDTHFLVKTDSLLKFSQSLSKLINHLFITDEIEDQEQVIASSIYLITKLFITIPDNLIIEILEMAINETIRTSDLAIQPNVVSEILSDTRDTANENSELIKSYFEEDLTDIDDDFTLDLLKAFKVIIGGADSNGSLIENVQKVINLFTYQMGLNESLKVYVLNVLKCHLCPNYSI